MDCNSLSTLRLLARGLRYPLRKDSAMNNTSTIWTSAIEAIETFVCHLSQSSYDFFVYGLYVVGIALWACIITSKAGVANQALNWCWLILAFLIAPRFPALNPESVFLKTLFFFVALALLLLAPSRLSMFLSANAAERHRIKSFLRTALLIAFVMNYLCGGS